MHILLLVLLILCLPISVATAAKVVRVAFPQQEGLTEISPNGDFSGYTYEYLQKLQEFTGWELDYVTYPDMPVNAQLAMALHQLKSGNVDLVGGLLKSPALEQQLLFPDNSFGIVSTTLVTAQDNPQVNAATLAMFDPLVVGLRSNATERNEETRTFLEKMGINATFVMCDSQEELLKLLKSEEVDVITNVSLNVMQDVRTVASFAPRPFYIATSVGNEALARELDEAIELLNTCFPNFQEALLHTYLDEPTTEFTLSHSEEEFFAQHDGILALAMPNSAPYSFVNEEGVASGIAVDILTDYAQQVGIPLTIEVRDVDGDFLQQLEQAPYDVILGLPSNPTYGNSLGIITTDTYMEAESILFFPQNTSVNIDTFSSVGVIQGSALAGFFPPESVVFFNTMAECVRAVNAREVSIGCGNRYQVAYYSQENYVSFDTLPMVGQQQGMAMAVTTAYGLELLPSLNRFLRSVSDMAIYEYSNAAIQQIRRSPLRLFIHENQYSAISIIVVILLMTAIGSLLLWRNQRKLKREHEKLRISEERFHLALQNTNISVWEYDMRKRCIIQTDHSMALHGFDKVIENVPESLVAHGYAHPEDIHILRDLYKRIHSGDSQADAILRVHTEGREGWWYEHVHYTVLHNELGQPACAIGISDDVTEKQELARTYLAETQYYESMLQDVCAVMIYDLTARKQNKLEMLQSQEIMVFTTDTLEDYFSHEAAHILEPYKIRKLMQSLNADVLIAAAKAGKRHYTYEYLRMFPDGIARWVLFSMNIVEEPHSGHSMMFTYLQDIDGQKQQMLALKQAAQRDSLTDLLNHKASLEQIEELLPHINKQVVSACIMIDLDNFKHVNDTLGHHYGDQALLYMANVLRQTLRINDVIGRIGGDEFIVFIRDLPSFGALEKKMEHLLHDLQYEISTDAHPIHVTASLGAAVYQDGDTMETLYKRADTALYHVKENGRNNYRIYKDTSA